MTVPGSLLVVVVVSLFVLQPVKAQQWLPWQGRASRHGDDPAKNLSSRPMLTEQGQRQPAASATATVRAAVAESELNQSGATKAEPARIASAPAVTSTAMTNHGVAAGQLLPTRRKTIDATSVVTRPVAASPNTPPSSALLSPASINPPVVSEPLPPVIPPISMQAQQEVIISSIGDDSAADPVIDTDVATIQITSCDEIGRCERLDTLRSGVGVEGPGDEANKRRPDNDAKRHVMQSVRSIW